MAPTSDLGNTCLFGWSSTKAFAIGFYNLAGGTKYVADYKNSRYWGLEILPVV